MAYTREQLIACEGATIPDLVGEGCKLLFVGINPGLQTAMTGIHFAHHSNRFWPALREAGLVDWLPDLSPVAPSVALSADDYPGSAATRGRSRLRHHWVTAGRGAGLIDWSREVGAGMTMKQKDDLIARGIGISNLVERATVRASELSREELVAGRARLERLVTTTRPEVVAIAGVTAYRDAFGDRQGVLGEQPANIVGARLWVVPNPSGLNAHETISSLAAWFTRVAMAAGVM